MKQILILAVSTALFFSIGNSQSDSTSLGGLRAMAGCWERRDDAKKLLISEQWMLPGGTSILGMGRTVKDGKTTDWEYMRIEERPDGLYFVARPRSNADETAFRLIKSAANQFIFENKEHDFPQRVIYKMERDKLTGRIEGMNNGKQVGIDYPMYRVKCV